MTQKIQGKLHYLQNYNTTEEVKIKFIDQIYQFNYHIYDMYMKDGQKRIKK